MHTAQDITARPSQTHSSFSKGGSQSWRSPLPFQQGHGWPAHPLFNGTKNLVKLAARDRTVARVTLCIQGLQDTSKETSGGFVARIRIRCHPGEPRPSSILQFTFFISQEDGPHGTAARRALDKGILTSDVVDEVQARLLGQVLVPHEPGDGNGIALHWANEMLHAFGPCLHQAIIDVARKESRPTPTRPN